MVIQNSIKILNELALIEEKIERIEGFLQRNQYAYDKEELINAILKTYIE